MKIAYVIVAITGALYFLLKKRRFDFLTIGYFSALMYFLPAFYGIVMSPYGQSDPVPSQLIPETYAVMLTVIVAILIGAVAFDQIPHRAHRHVGLSGTASAGNWALLLAITGCAMSILTTGLSALLNADKNVVIQNVNRWLIFWELGGAYAVIFFFSRRQWFRLALAALVVLADVFVGFRLAFAFAFIACFTLWAERQGRSRFGIRNLRPIVLAASMIAFLFMYKAVYVLVKMGAWSVVAQQLTSPAAYNDTITSSEPFVTQTILNQVLLTNYHVPFEHFQSVLYQFLFFAPNLGAQGQMSFNDYFQPELFPAITDMGLANNIWAEMWSSGGWPLLLGFIVIYVVVLCYLSLWLRIDNPELRGAIALPGVTWAFYLHRNDLFVEANFLKRLLLIASISMIAAMLSHDATHRLRRRVRRTVQRVAQRRRQRRLEVSTP